MRAPNLIAIVLCLASCSSPVEGGDEPGWTRLFDGTGLAGWEVTRFGGEGEVELQDGRMILGRGSPLTGVTWRGELPRGEAYEVRLGAARLDGTDFFCGLTFPVGEDCCSLILGGWGGALVGLSCIDGWDAASNETTRFVSFEAGRTYRVRLRVSPERIEAWIDGESIVDVAIAGRKIGVRSEVLLSRPLGIAAFSTIAAISDVRIRPLVTRP